MIYFSLSKGSSHTFQASIVVIRSLKLCFLLTLLNYQLPCLPGSIKVDGALSSKFTVTPGNGTLKVAEGEDVNMTWQYDVATGETLSNIVWGLWDTSLNPATVNPYLIKILSGAPFYQYTTPDYYNRTKWLGDASFQLLNVNKTLDERQFGCVLDFGPLGVLTDNISLVVQVGPFKVDTLPSLVTCTVGQVCDLGSCKSSGDPTPKVTWSHEGQMMNESYGQASLTLTSFTPGDHMNIYECKASNDVKTITIGTITIFVNHLPYNTSLVSSAVDNTVTSGDNVALNCSTDARPSANFSFFFNDQLLTTNQNGILIINSVNSTHHGNYSCNAKNTVGQEQSNTIYLNVQVPSSITLISDNKTVIQGNNLTLECHAPGNPVPNITWTKDGGSVLSSSLSFNTSGFPTVVKSLLMISSVQKSDNGVYQCTAYNKVGNQVMKQAKVIVFYPPSSTTLVSSADDNTVTSGESVTLNCSTDARPSANFSFFFNNQMLTANQNGIFIINPVNSTHHGNYSCNATNEVGQEQSNMIYLNVQVPSLITFLTKKQTVVEERNLIIECHASGNPVPTITWTKDGIVLSSSISHNISSFPAVVISLLNITSAQRSDDGIYQCTANNGVGNQTRQSSVTVLYKPVLDSNQSSTSPQESWIGHQLVLRCKFDGLPPPETTWCPFPSNYTVSVDGNGVSQLTVFPTISSDFGNYTCRGNNSLGVTENILTVFQLELPDPPFIQSTVALVYSLTLTWTQPVYDGGTEITKYTIKIRKIGNSTWDLFDTISNDLQYTISNLSKNTSYQVCVSSWNKVGEGNCSIIIENTTLPKGPPDAPVILNNKTSLDSDSLTLRWTKPRDGGAAITNYIIMYKHSDEDGQFPDPFTEINLENVETLNYTKDDLQRGREYQFKVYAVNSEGDTSSNIWRVKIIKKTATVPGTTGEWWEDITQEPGLYFLIGGSVLVFFIIIFFIIFCCLCCKRRTGEDELCEEMKRDVPMRAVIPESIHTNPGYSSAESLLSSNESLSSNGLYNRSYDDLDEIPEHRIVEGAYDSSQTATSAAPGLVSAAAPTYAVINKKKKNAIPDILPTSQQYDTVDETKKNSQTEDQYAKVDMSKKKTKKRPLTENSEPTLYSLSRTKVSDKRELVYAELASFQRSNDRVLKVSDDHSNYASILHGVKPPVQISEENNTS